MSAAGKVSNNQHELYYNPRPQTNFLDRVLIQIRSNADDKAEISPLTDSPIGLGSSARAIQYPQFLLFGDSITQFSTLTLQAWLETAYIRKLDIVNRGFSGYTTTMAKEVLQQLFPRDVPRRSTIKLATICLGANDAASKGNPQHVPHGLFVDNLKSMLNDHVFKLHGTKLILVTPPPVNDHQLPMASDGTRQRLASNTSYYCEAVVRTGQMEEVLTLDLWSAIMKRCGWTKDMPRRCGVPASPARNSNPLGEVVRSIPVHIPGCHHIPERLPGATHTLSDFLVDGLHLNTKGYEVLYEELMNLIAIKIPDYLPQNLPDVFPGWKDVLGIS